MNAPLELPDPRRWPAAASPLQSIVAQCLAAGASVDADAHEAALDAALDALLADAASPALAEAFDGAPSAAACRLMRRRLAPREAAALRTATIAAPLFALPLVIVAGREAGPAVVRLAGAPPPPAPAPTLLQGTIDAPDAVAALMRENGALGGSLQFALSASLCSAESLDLRALPGLLAHARGALLATSPPPLALAPAPIAVEGAQESVHLRYLVGSAVCGPQADPFHDTSVARWGMPVARALSKSLARPDTTVLVLPRAPQRLVEAVATGRAAQREIALQLFAGNALRRMRGSVGEAIAMIGAHETPDAAGGGELRVSLSSPLEMRDAEGFRYPLLPQERVPDALADIVTLLRDLRVADIRAAPGVQPDRDPATGLRRFVRPDDAAARAPLH